MIANLKIGMTVAAVLATTVPTSMIVVNNLVQTHRQPAIAASAFSATPDSLAADPERTPTVTMLATKATSVAAPTVGAAGATAPAARLNDAFDAAGSAPVAKAAPLAVVPALPDGVKDASDRSIQCSNAGADSKRGRL